VRRALWLLQLRHSPPVPAAYFALPEETLRGHRALLWGLYWELSQACPAPASAPQAAAAPGRSHAHASVGAAGAAAVAALDDLCVLYRPPLAVSQGLPLAVPAPPRCPETALREEGAVAVPVPPPSLAAAVRRWYADDIRPRGEEGAGTVPEAVATDANAAHAGDGGDGKASSVHGGYAAFTASLAAAGADVPCEAAALSLSPQPIPASTGIGAGTADDGDGEGDSLPASPGVAPAPTAAATAGDRRALRALALLVWLDSTVGLPPPQRSDFLCGYRAVILLPPTLRRLCPYILNTHPRALVPLCLNRATLPALADGVYVRAVLRHLQGTSTGKPCAAAFLLDDVVGEAEAAGTEVPQALNDNVVQARWRRVLDFVALNTASTTLRTWCAKPLTLNRAVEGRAGTVMTLLDSLRRAYDGSSM